MRQQMRSVALLFFALPFLLPAAADRADAGTIQIEYSVRVRGLPVGKADLDAEFADGRYTMKLAGKLTGLARLFSDARTTATVVGEVDEDRLAPTKYRHRWTEGDDSETIDMRFSGRGLADTVLKPVEKHPERYAPITDADKVDVSDMVSASVWLASSGVTRDICSRKLPLTDGRRRFDIALKFSRFEDFATADRSFQRRAVVCSFRYEKVAGHRIDGKGKETITGGDGMEVWMTPTGTGFATPVRIQVNTRIGRIVFVATKIQAQ
jgi:Protein of unknown function (DUF3108)